MKRLILFILFANCTISYSQNNIVFPITFEDPLLPSAAQIVYFGGGSPVGSAVRVANPNPSGQNQSANVIRFIKGVNAPGWAGMEFPNLATATSGFAGAMPFLCFDYYTTAPVGTPILFKMDGAPDINSSTTVQNAWGQICFTPSTAHNARVKPVVIFRLNQTDAGPAHNPNFTVYVDNINQYATIPLAFTPNSQYFCPNAAVTLSTSVASDWYASQYGGVALATSTTSFTTPILSASTSYWVQGLTPITPPTISGQWPNNNNATGTADHGVSNTRTFFTAKINGTLNSVQYNQKITPISPSSCTYTVTVFNLTASTTPYGPTDVTCSCADGAQVTRTVNVPLIQGNNYEFRINVSGVASCKIGSDNIAPVTYPVTTNSYMEFTGHIRDGLASDSRFSTQNWIVTPSSSLPPRAQVNAIANCALPVELLKFTAREERGDAILTWITASETNSDYFLVRKSIDGVNFKNIGKVKGAGTTSYTSKYSFTDKNLEQGLTYYQITQVDFDGKQSSSSLVAIDKKLTYSYNIYPNPTDGIFTISKTIDTSEEVEIEIKDVTGRTIEQYKFFGQKPLFKEILNVNNYPPGVYTLSISTINQVNVIKLIKQ
jgi:hypothetical protein